MVCCGLTTLDLTYVVDAPPGRGQKVVAREMRIDVGGPAANAARVVHALGGRTTLVTALGRGPLGLMLRSRLAGITIDDVAPPDHQPPVSTVLVSGDDRSVVSVNATRLESWSAPPPRAGVLLVDGHLTGAGVALATEARRAGAAVVFDGGSWKDGTEDLLPHVDVAAVSSGFTLPGGEEVLAGLRRRGVRVAARTDGPRPIEVLSDGGRETLEVRATTVVDSLGAGDVFHGVLAWALAAGWGAGEALRRAAAVASLSVAYPGVLGWLGDQPRWAEALA